MSAKLTTCACGCGSTSNCRARETEAEALRIVAAQMTNGSPRICPGCRFNGCCPGQFEAEKAQECYQAFLQLQPTIGVSDVPSADRPARVACAPARRLRKAINPAVAHSPVYPLEIRQAAFDAAVREAVRQAQAIADYQHGVETEFLGPADTGFGG